MNIEMLTAPRGGVLVVRGSWARRGESWVAFGEGRRARVLLADMAVPMAMISAREDLARLGVEQFPEGWLVPAERLEAVWSRRTWPRTTPLSDRRMAMPCKGKRKKKKGY